METHRFRHLKRYVVAGILLCFLLGGTAYASVKVSEHHASGITCGGRCPARYVYWGYITATGQPGSLSPGPTADQTALGGRPVSFTKVGLGSWLVYFSGANLTNCARFGNITSGQGEITVGQYNSSNPDPEGIPVQTYNTQGNPADMNFDVVALCGGGIGAQSTNGSVVGG